MASTVASHVIASVYLPGTGPYTFPEESEQQQQQQQQEHGENEEGDDDDNTVTVDDIVVGVARKCGVGPVERHLFGLCVMPSSAAAASTAESTIAWLHPGHRVTYAEGAPPLRVTFRFCYMVPDLNHQFSFDDGHGDKVLRLSRSTIRYLFHQCKHDLTTGKIPAVLHLKDAVKKCLGFALVDMLRIMRQEKIEGVRQLERKHSFKDMLPDGALSSFNLLERYYYAPKRFRKQLTIYNNIYKRHDEFFCMELYISQLLGTCKEVEYMQQRFPVRVSRSETTVEGEVRTIMQQAEIKISPFHAEQPGVRLKLSERKEWDHVCTIEELISLAFHKGAPVVVQLDDAQESPPPLPPRPISLRSPLPLTSPSLTLTNNELTHETNDDADFDHYRRMGAPPAAALANEFVFEHETSEQTSRGGQIDDAVLLPPGGSTSIVDMTGSLATTTATSLTDLEPSSPEGASGSNESCEDPSRDTAPGTDEQPENSDSGNATEREPPAGAATIVKRTCRVDIMRKNGPPEFLEFESESMAEAFVMLLDGYYRLTEKFHFNLCTAFVSPSLEELKRNKCHGAVSKEFASGKLKERAQWKEGCYLVRESSTQYDQVCLDVCVQDQARPTSFTLQVVKKKGRYSLKDQDDALFTDIMSLVRRIGDSQQIPLSRCIHPLETDKSNLLMCRKRRQQKEEQMVAVNTEFLQPLIIPSEQLSLSAGAVMARGTFLEVHKATWELQNNMPVAVQCLRSETFTADLMKEYQDSCSRFVFLRQESLLRVYGVQLSPFALIVEQLPLGPLDQYLQAHRTKLKPVDLVEAAAFLANGLWYMEDKAVCHGNIRCCNVMACHDATGKFRVKLSDPGLPSTHADRIHWLPPENFAVINDARSYQPSRRADIWAFGTTLWEIFEFGARPRVDDLDAVEYLSQTLSDTEKLVYAYMQGARLQQPGVLATLQEECLGIERDIYMGVIMRCWAESPANCGSAHSLFRDLHTAVVFCLQSSRRVAPAAAAKPASSVADDDIAESMRIGFGCLEFGKRLGKGHYGEVRKATLLGHCGLPAQGEEVAVKKLLPTDQVEDICAEIRTLARLRHDNIVQIRGSTVDPQDCMTCLIMEYAPLGCLLDHLKRPPPTGLKHKISFAIDIANGMRYLHQQQVVHRDLAARNVLVFKDDWVKITDFGLSRQVESDYYMLQTRRGLPLLWTAPEVKDDNRFYKESDVWSYGVTLWEVFSDGTDPIIQHDGDPSGSGTMLANHTAFLRHGERLPNIDGCAERVYALMQRCWQWDKHMRPTFPQIVDEVSQWRGALLVR